MSVNAVMAQTFLPGVSRNEIEVFDPQAETWQMYILANYGTLLLLFRGF